MISDNMKLDRDYTPFNLTTVNGPQCELERNKKLYTVGGTGTSIHRVYRVW